MSLYLIPKTVMQAPARPASGEAQDGPNVAGVGSSTEKSRDRDEEVAGGAILPGTGLPTPSDKATGDSEPQPMAQPVRLAGGMTTNGYEPENWEWVTVLICTDPEGRRVECDPMSIPPEVLAAAGYVPRRTRFRATTPGLGLSNGPQLTPPTTRSKSIRKESTRSPGRAEDDLPDSQVPEALGRKPDCHTSRDSDLPGRKLNVREAARFLGLSVSTMNKMRIRGDGPRYIKAGRRVLYDSRDLEEWAAQRKRNHTSEKSEGPREHARKKP
jgi:predicted DNA-binding transcriptional regulator AlpA